jgi:hypothetical protein
VTTGKYHPGHDLHFIHAKHLGGTPWGWRPGTVSEVREDGVRVDYLLEPGAVDVWHHEVLPVVVGTPVRVHEQFHGFDVDGSWLNVRLTGGLGAVPQPVEPGIWADEARSAVVVDLARGEAVVPAPVEVTDR